MPGTQVASLVLDALDEVDAALRVVLGAGGVDWRSPAADRYRAALDDVAARLRVTRAQVGAAVHASAALDAAVAAQPWWPSLLGGGPVAP